MTILVGLLFRETGISMRLPVQHQGVGEYRILTYKDSHEPRNISQDSSMSSPQLQSRNHQSKTEITAHCQIWWHYTTTYFPCIINVTMIEHLQSITLLHLNTMEWCVPLQRPPILYAKVDMVCCKSRRPYDSTSSQKI